MNDLYRPPAPRPLTPLRSLLRTVREGDGNLLSLVPKAAYEKSVTPLGYSRRGIILINDPEGIRSVMTNPTGLFPKNDLFAGALGPLVGDSIFVSEGERWEQQRRMIDPAFSQLRITTAFHAMQAAVEDFVDRTRGTARSPDEHGKWSLDSAMSHLTADVICRTIFSRPLSSWRSREVFDAFGAFERGVASVSLAPLIFGKAWQDVEQPASVLAACADIRRYIGEWVDPRLAPGAAQHDDLLGALIDARDPHSGTRFTREELIDQIGVFFLAGHETTASALTWTFYILSRQPAVMTRLRTEVTEVTGGEPVTFAQVKQLAYTRSVFREVLRLYPPITFIPRVAAETTRVAGRRVRRGAMVMISPWATHRNELLWRDADRFVADRFMPGAADDDRPNTFLTFGSGPRVCVGAGFATIESTLILATLCQHFDFEPQAPDQVRPIARLTTRPAEEILCRVTERRP
jgi:cytochrome P450